MPKIPTGYEMGLGQVKQTGAGSTPFQNLSTSTSMFGSVQAQQAKEVGSLLTDQAQKMIRAEDERAAMEVEQDIRDWQFEATQGEDGVYRKLGGTAIGSTKAVGEDYAKFSGKLLQGKIVSSATRQKLEAYIGQKGDNIRGEVDRYEQKQKTIYDNGLREARIQGAIEDAATYSNDPAKIVQSINTIISTNKRSADANGWSPEEAKQISEDDISKMHMGVIDRLLAQKNGSLAAEYLDAYKDQIDGDDIANAEKAVSGGVISQKAQNETDMIMAQDIPLKDALVKARAEHTGAERDAIVKRLKIRYGEASAEQKANDKASLEDGWALIQKGGTPDDLTPAQLAIAGRQTESMWKMAESIQTRGKGFALTTQTGIVQEWLGKTNAEIVDEDLTILQTQATEADFNKIVGRQNSAKRAIKEMRDNPNQGADVERLLKEFAPKTWNVGIKAASPERRAQAQRARDSMNEFVSATIDKTSKLPTELEKRKEMARIMHEIETNDFLFLKTDTVVSEQGDTPLHELHMDDESLSQSTLIPVQHLDDVKSYIIKLNQPVTIDNMMKVWASRKSK